ncbi:MAG TPA: phosphate ABC transporter permease subunit PstC [Nitrospiria bacterium]|nr:phosphate ABC transporter permease subunit PstC [Candidatus Manganitrophaceae bacterium]HIL33921.1 phosphate ABC transporter permease subunit PstC [Candidatus Manganitrophaceae bacterium]
MLRGAASISGMVVLFIIVFLFLEALPALKEIGPLRFFNDPSWHPNDGTFDLTPMLMGTLLTTLGALALATPLGILSAVFIHYYAPPALGQVYRKLIGLLAGIPSVVYGFWALVVLVPIIGRIHPPGPSLSAGILILALMILPTIALLADASLTAVPSQILQGAAALGLSRWSIITGVALPAARAGLTTSIILATGRAIGETMALLMVSGNVVQVPKSLFDPIRTLTANIALEMAYAMGNHRSALFVSGLVLMAIIATLVFFSEGLTRDGMGA